MRWLIPLIASVSWLSPALANELTSTSFRVRASAVMSAGDRALRDSGSQIELGVSVAQPAPTGLGVNAVEQIISSGLWSRAGAPIDFGSCVGDCGDDGSVTVDEIVLAVNIALGTAEISACPALDRNGDGSVTVEEIIAAVNNALTGCDAMGTISGGAPPPQRIGIQGRLLGTDGPVDIELGLWTASTGGDQLYRETHAGVDPVNRVLDIELGAGSAQFGQLEDALTSASWLEVAVDGEDLEPRIQVVSIPYALRAGRVPVVSAADRAAGMPPGSRPVTTAGAAFDGSVVVGGPGGASVTLRPAAAGLGASLEVAGTDGASRGELSTDELGLGQLLLVDAGNSVGVTLGTRRAAGGAAGLLSDLFGEGGFLETTGPNGNSNVQMTSLSGSENHGYLSVDDANGESRGGLYVDTPGAGRLDLRDTDGVVRTSLRSESIRTSGPNGAVNAFVTNLVGNDDHGFVFAAGAGGGSRAELFVDSSRDGALQLRDNAGARRVLAHEGAIETFGANGSANADLGDAGASANLGCVAVAGTDGNARAAMSVNLFDFGVLEARGSGLGVIASAGASTLSPNSGRMEIFAGEFFARARLEHLGFSDEAVLTMGDGNVTRVQLASAGTAEFFDDEAQLIGAVGTEGDHGVAGATNAAGGGAFISADDGRGEVVVGATPGVDAAAMQVLSSGAGLIEARGPNGMDNVRLTTPGDNPDEGFMSAVAANGNSVAQMLIDSAGNGLLTVRRPDASLGAEMSVFEELGILEARGQNGNANVIISARGSRTNAGSLTVNNSAGAERILFLGLPLSGAGDDGTVFVRGPNGQGNVTMLQSSIIVQDSGGGGQARMSVEGGFGTFSADSKNFVVAHPTRQGHKIVYTVLEGPQADVYHRGTAHLTEGRTVIELPEHFLAVAEPASITVQLTPAAAQSKGLGFDLDANHRVLIYELDDGGGSYPVYYVVHARRRGFDAKPVVIASERPASPPTQAESLRVEPDDRGDASS